MVLLLNAYPHAPWRVLVALAPVIPMIFGLLAFVRFFSKMDELQRRIQLEAFAFAFGGTAIVSFTYGFLENAGFPALSWIWVFPLMMALWGIGAGIASRRYQ